MLILYYFLLQVVNTYGGEEDGDEECPAQVANQDAESLPASEWVKFMSKEHAENRMLVLRPLSKVAPSLREKYEIIGSCTSLSFARSHVLPSPFLRIFDLRG